jgi:cytochrome b involved in lipid metabolism
MSFFGKDFLISIPLLVALFTFEEVQKHDSPKDCWMVIDKKVYDVTQYLPDHEEHTHVLPKFCGKDASVGWHTKGPMKQKEHSKKAILKAKKYWIGDLK